MKEISISQDHLQMDEVLLKNNSNEMYGEFQNKLQSRSSQKCEAVVHKPFVFRECTQVMIKWDQATYMLSYETKKRESGSNVAVDKRSSQASPRLVQRLLNRFGWKKEHGGDGGNGGGSNDVMRRVGALNSYNLM